MCQLFVILQGFPFSLSDHIIHASLVGNRYENPCIFNKAPSNGAISYGTVNTPPDLRTIWASTSLCEIIYYWSYLLLICGFTFCITGTVLPHSTWCMDHSSWICIITRQSESQEQAAPSSASLQIRRPVSISNTTLSDIYKVNIDDDVNIKKIYISCMKWTSSNLNMLQNKTSAQTWLLSKSCDQSNLLVMGQLWFRLELEELSWAWRGGNYAIIYRDIWCHSMNLSMEGVQTEKRP